MVSQLPSGVKEIAKFERTNGSLAFIFFRCSTNFALQVVNLFTGKGRQMCPDLLAISLRPSIISAAKGSKQLYLLSRLWN